MNEAAKDATMLGVIPLLMVRQWRTDSFGFPFFQRRNILSTLFKLPSEKQMTLDD